MKCILCAKIYNTERNSRLIFSKDLKICYDCGFELVTKICQSEEFYEWVESISKETIRNEIYKKHVSRRPSCPL